MWTASKLIICLIELVEEGMVGLVTNKLRFCLPDPDHWIPASHIIQRRPWTFTKLPVILVIL